MYISLSFFWFVCFNKFLKYNIRTQFDSTAFCIVFFSELLNLKKRLKKRKRERKEKHHQQQQHQQQEGVEQKETIQQQF